MNYNYGNYSMGGCGNFGPGGYGNAMGGYAGGMGGYGNGMGGYSNGMGGYANGVVQSQYCSPAMGTSTFGASQYAVAPASPVAYLFGTPSLKPCMNTNPMADANALREAMRGFGCDKTAIMQILCTRTNFQRQQIRASFKQMYGKDLIKELKSELSWDFEDLMVALMQSPHEYDATELYKSMEGLGTRENVLIEIMCSRSNYEINQIKAYYRTMFKTELEKDIVGDTSGYFKNFLVALCTGTRDESGYVDYLKAQQAAAMLYRAGEGRLGTDESAFLGILCSQNFAQLKTIFNEYHRLTGHTMAYAIEAEFSGDIKDGLLALYSIIMNRPGFFAIQFENSMKGLGTRDRDLIRLAVTRCEIDMVEIRNEYFRMYGRPLQQRIADDTSGKYKDALLMLVNGN
uniref:Annexin n=1 Tax=Strongyloides papillosus TaxID=174720 RepID=A0A0N5B6N0_STREA